MGTHVWKRESVTTSDGVKRHSESASSSGSAAAVDGAASAENPARKRQRLAPWAGPAQGVAGSCNVAAGSAEAAAGNNPSSQAPQGPAHAAKPVQRQQVSSGGIRGSSLRGRAGGRRQFAATGRGTVHDAEWAKVDAVGAAAAAAAGGAAGGGFQPAADAGQGAGRRAGVRHFPGRGRIGGRQQMNDASDFTTQQQSLTAAAAAEEALRAKERELKALKAKIAQQQAKQDALKAAQELRKQQQQQQQELQQRKVRLNNAFSSAFASAAKARQEQQAAAATATVGAAERTSQSIDQQVLADEVEVLRVMSSKNDYEVLQLKPGCDKAALKKRYRELTLRLHPDKCKAAGASVAFQRAHKAYTTLQAHVL